MIRLGLLFFVLLVGAGALDGLENAQYYIDLVNNANTSWTAGHNFPPGTSYEHLFGSEVDIDFHLIPDHRDDPTAPGEVEIPESFDASEKWPFCPYIKHVRDQGPCGSCWAVSTASVMTDRLCIASNGSFTYPVSAEELITCCHACTKTGDGCVSGIQAQAWVYAKTKGLVTGGDYGSDIGCQPYQHPPCGHSKQSKKIRCRLIKRKTPLCAHHCLNPQYNISFDQDHHKFRDAFFIKADEKAIQREILHRGPVAALMHMYSDFGHYRSGVYQRVNNKHNKRSGSHGVKIIGWGTENGLHYWTVANSWSTDWGDNGFFKIRRMKNGVNIENYVTYGVA